MQHAARAGVLGIAAGTTCREPEPAAGRPSVTNPALAIEREAAVGHEHVDLGEGRSAPNPRYGARS